MSYARWGWEGSEVYVFRAAHRDGGQQWICMSCRLTSVDVAPFLEPQQIDHAERSEAGMIAHLETHRAAGHGVPQSAIDRLQREIDSGGVMSDEHATPGMRMVPLSRALVDQLMHEAGDVLPLDLKLHIGTLMMAVAAEICGRIVLVPQNRVSIEEMMAILEELIRGYVRTHEAKQRNE